MACESDNEDSDDEDSDEEADGVVVLGPPNREVAEYLDEQIPKLIQLEATRRGHWPDILAYSSLMSTFQFDETAGVLMKVLNGLRYDLINENEFGGWALHFLRFNRSDFEYIQ